MLSDFLQPRVWTLRFDIYVDSDGQLSEDFRGHLFLYTPGLFRTRNAVSALIAYAQLVYPKYCICVITVKRQPNAISVSCLFSMPLSGIDVATATDLRPSLGASSIATQYVWQIILIHQIFLFPSSFGGHGVDILLLIFSQY